MNTKEVLNMKLNEVQIIISHSVSQYYPLITLLSLCILASYLFTAVIIHYLISSSHMYFKKKGKLISLGPR